MPYRPKYCCQCGEKVERIDWNLWTSRRFCELCETELKIHEWAGRLVVLGGVLFGLFGLGTYLMKPEQPLNVAPNQIAVVSKETINQKNAVQPSVADESARNTAQAQTANQVLQAKPPLVKEELKAAKIQAQPPVPVEKVYFCGAETKKGTPCSRRVKGGGRCWQHAGQTALLPPEKLLAVQ